MTLDGYHAKDFAEQFGFSFDGNSCGSTRPLLESDPLLKQKLALGEKYRDLLVKWEGATGVEEKKAIKREIVGTFAELECLCSGAPVNGKSFLQDFFKFVGKVLRS